MFITSWRQLPWNLISTLTRLRFFENEYYDGRVKLSKLIPEEEYDDDTTPCIEMRLTEPNHKPGKGYSY